MSFENLSPMMQEAAEDFCLMEFTAEPDGEGGFVRVWKDGFVFSAIVAHDTTIVAQQAEGQGLASTYRFLIPQNVPLAFPDVVKRRSDGQTFQITTDSKDRKTPTQSTMGLSSVMAQKWRLT